MGPAAPPLTAAASVTEAASSNTGPADSLDTRINAMKAEQNDLAARRKQVRKELKNAERKRQRLKKRARNLSDADLEELISMRKAKTSASSAEPTSGSSSAGSAATTCRNGGLWGLRGCFFSSLFLAGFYMLGRAHAALA